MPSSSKKVNAQKVIPKRNPPFKNANCGPLAHPSMRFSKESLSIKKEVAKEVKEGKSKQSLFKFLKKFIPCASRKSISKNFSDGQENDGCKNAWTNSVVPEEDAIVVRYTNVDPVVGEAPKVDGGHIFVEARHEDGIQLHPTHVAISVNNVPQLSQNEIIEVRRNRLPLCDDYADLERRKLAILQRIRDERLTRQNVTALASKAAHTKAAGSSLPNNDVTPVAIVKGVLEVPPPPPFCKEEMDARKGVVLEAARRRKLLEALALDMIIGVQQLPPQLPEQQDSVSVSSEASEVSGGVMDPPVSVGEEHEYETDANVTSSATFIQPIVGTPAAATPNFEVRRTLSRFNVPALVFAIGEEEAVQRLGERGFEVAQEAENPFSDVFRRARGYRKHRGRLDAIIEGEEYARRVSYPEECELSKISFNVFITPPTPPDSIASSYSESETSYVYEESDSADDSRYARRAQEVLDSLQAFEAFIEPATTFGPTRAARVGHHSEVDKEDSDEGSDDAMIAQDALNSAQALEELLNGGFF